MSRIHSGLEYKDFTQPSGIVSVSVCSKSGKLAIDGECTMDPRGTMVINEYFASDTVPTEGCDHHVLVDVCAESNMKAGLYCTNIIQKAYIFGGTPGTQDGEFLVDQTFLDTVCTLHTVDTLITPPTDSNSTTTTDPNHPGGTDNSHETPETPSGDSPENTDPTKPST